MFAVVIFGGFENQNGGGGTGTVFHFGKSGNSTVYTHVMTPVRFPTIIGLRLRAFGVTPASE